MTKIIGIAGAIGAGKTTLSNALYFELSEDKRDVWETSCAWPLYQIAEQLGFKVRLQDQGHKDQPQVQYYSDFGESVQAAIESVLGSWEDNDKALLYTYFMDAFVTPVNAGALDRIEVSLRHFLRTLGNAGRKVRRGLWAEHLKKEAEFRVPRGYVLIGDIRFPSEAAICTDLIWVKGGQATRNDDESESYHDYLQGAATIEMDNTNHPKMRAWARAIAESI